MVEDPEETKFAERALIAFALGTLKAESAVPELAEFVRPEVRVDVRLGAAEALKRIGGADATRALAPALRDERYGVRAAAVEAVEAAEGREFAPELAQLSESDPQWLIRAQAAEALGAMKDDRWVPLLQRIAKEDRFLVSLGATSALYRIHSPNSDSALRELRTTAPSRLRRLDARFVAAKTRLWAWRERRRRS